MKAIRLTKVLEKTGISRSQLYRLIQAGKFPHGVKLSERICVWEAAVVDAWMEEKFKVARERNNAVK